MSRIQKSLQNYLTDSKKEQKFTRLEPFIKLSGHLGNIEDLAFKYDSTSCELVSVGIDRYILFWDIRTGSNKPVAKALQAHFDDINTVDWCRLDQNYIATGSNDQKVSVLDIRKLSSEANSRSALADKNQLCPAVVR
jgi:WD40 repeat protein